jgi:YbbR domain-containing protein
VIKSAFRQLRSNLGAFVLALLLSFVVWIAAGLQTDSFADRRFTNIPILLTNQPDNTVLLEPIVEQVVVTARARDSILAELKAASFEATLDLSQVQPGVPAAVRVVVTCSNDLVRIEAVDPPVLSVSLAAVETVTRSVTIRMQGQVATGFTIARPLVAQGQVAIRGPEPYLSQVISVTGSVDVDGARRNVTATVAVELLGADGKPVSEVESVPAEVQVQVPVRSLAQFKPDVTIVPVVRGEPAPGYRKGEVRVEPSSVTLEGPSSVLNTLPDFVETMPMTITGATENLSRQSLLQVPADVGVVEASYVTVTVEILPILGTRTVTSTMELIRVPAGMKATPVPSEVVITLEGPDARLTALKLDDILIVLDLRGYSKGIHLIKPDVLAPEGIRVLTVDPETIAVLIEPLPTPTPVPTPAPTPTPTHKP